MLSIHGKVAYNFINQHLYTPVVDADNYLEATILSITPNSKELEGTNFFKNGFQKNTNFQNMESLFP